MNNSDRFGTHDEIVTKGDTGAFRGSDTVLIISADHGGVGKKHGGLTMAEIEIPWLMMGPGVKAGPGVKDDVDTYDTAATAAYILKLQGARMLDWTPGNRGTQVKRQ